MLDKSKVNKEAMELFCQALESTDKPQGEGRLRYYDAELDAVVYCALGIGTVALVEQGLVTEEEAWMHGALSQTQWRDKVASIYGFLVSPGASNYLASSYPIDPVIKVPDYGYVSLSHANDTLHMSFWDIAQALRAEYLKDEG